MKLYGISGLGADERVFTSLQLNVPITPLPWLTPFPSESIANYCKRLSNGIDTTEEFCLIGVSFGGMMACELNKILTPKHTILISSAALSSHIPIYYKLLRFIKLEKWLPDFMLFPPPLILNQLFGAKTPEEKLLLRSIAKDTDPVFARWAIAQILNWTNDQIPSNMSWIHGNKDKILPFYPNNAYIIENGSHFMIVNKAHDISIVINRLLNC